MTRRIITRREEKTKPLRSAALSLLLTGLGEIDCGSPARGMSLFLMRLLLLMTAPLYVRTHPDTNGMAAFLVTTIPVIIISVISPLQAGLVSFKKKTYHPGWFNSFMLYPVFYIIGTAATAGALLLFTGTVSPMRISDMRSPVFTRGDIYIITKYPAAYHAGEMVLFSDNGISRASRILATGSDTVAYFEKKPLVNESPLPVEIFSREELETLGLPGSSDVLAERNGRTRYPISMPDNATGTEEEPASSAFSIKNNEAALLDDIRNSETRLQAIPVSHITGRIDGILYSPSRSRVLLPCSLGEGNE